MFTGIIEHLGKVGSIEEKGTNKTFSIESDLSPQLKIDESICHNGVCLTIETTRNNFHTVTAIAETLIKTNLNDWKAGDIINLEQSLTLNSRLDGHIVQGHVDTIGVCIDKKQLNGSNEFTFEFDKKFASLIIEKGSICVNGVSLTAYNVMENKFTVAIIPYTFGHTNFSSLKINMKVNLEFDMIGKYINRIASLHST